MGVPRLPEGAIRLSDGATSFSVGANMLYDTLTGSQCVLDSKLCVKFAIFPLNYVEKKKPKKHIAPRKFGFGFWVFWVFCGWTPPIDYQKAFPLDTLIMHNYA